MKILLPFLFIYSVIKYMDIAEVQVMLYSKIICDLYPTERLSLSK